MDADELDDDAQSQISWRLVLSIAAYILFVMLGLLAYPLVLKTVRGDDTPVIADPRAGPLTRQEVIAKDVGPLPRHSRPIQPPASWMTSDDYPAGSLRDGRTGIVSMRFVVTVDGRVVRCTAAHTSGSPLLDATACGLMEERGRYFPARDAAGRAVPEVRTQRVRWQFPDG